MEGHGLRAGEMLAGAGGAGLLASTFAPWYEDGARLSAWQAFGVIDGLIALTALGAIALAVLAATRRAPALPVAMTVALAALAPVVLLIVGYRLLDPPGSSESVDVLAGTYLGLACLGLVLLGSWRAISDEHADSPAAAPVGTRPAPPAAASPGRAGDPPAP